MFVALRDKFPRSEYLLLQTALAYYSMRGVCKLISCSHRACSLLSALLMRGCFAG